MTDTQPSIHDRLEAATGLNGDTLRGQLADQGLTVVVDETITDRAAIRAVADEREPEPMDAPGAVAVRLQAELADVRHTLRLRSDALARVTREADALRAKVAEGRRIIGWLTEAVEGECEDDPEICHGYDRYEGRCALLRDLERALAALSTGEGQHVAREVFTADGIPFVRCSCSTAKSPTSHRWLSEHVPNGGAAELQAVVKRQADQA